LAVLSALSAAVSCASARYFVASAARTSRTVSKVNFAAVNLAASAFLATASAAAILAAASDFNITRGLAGLAGDGPSASGGAASGAGARASPRALFQFAGQA